ncbi:MAG: Hint domain-containing protein [Rhizobiales bacterium]|nr:Hint domain-containing protein [Hyphomicrobiales bacterium]
MSIEYHKLSDSSLVQNWSQASLLSGADDWSGVPSIQGFSNVQFGSGVGTDARAFVFDSVNADIATNIFTSPSQFSTETGTNGGVAEFQDFGIVGLGAGGAASVPNLVLYLDTTDMSAPVTLNFDVQDLDSTSNDAVQQLNVQYRIGDTGNWTNLPDGYFADVTQPDATPTTHVSLTLPTDVLGHAQLQVRIMTADANGNDEWIGIDNIVVACFLRGTLVRTPASEVPIETLSIGDEVLVLRQQGGAETTNVETIKWIGKRSYATAFLTKDSPVAPVLIRAGALDEGMPRQDLRVSPEHAMLIDGVLVPAIDLVNGTSIVRELDGDSVEYFHIELDSHGVVYANGAPSESYVNHGNRRMFANWLDYVRLYGEDEPQRDESGAFVRCRSCVREGPALDAIRVRLEARSRMLVVAA